MVRRAVAPGMFRRGAFGVQFDAERESDDPRPRRARAAPQTSGSARVRRDALVRAGAEPQAGEGCHAFTPRPVVEKEVVRSWVTRT